MRYHLTPGRKAIIKKSINNKCWRGCGEQGMLLHCWWECKLVQPLWRTVWKSLKKLKTDIIWPCNPTPGQKSREKHDLKGYVDPMFTASDRRFWAFLFLFPESSYFRDPVRPNDKIFFSGNKAFPAFPGRTVVSLFSWLCFLALGH